MKIYPNIFQETIVIVNSSFVIFFFFSLFKDEGSRARLSLDLNLLNNINAQRGEFFEEERVGNLF